MRLSSWFLSFELVLLAGDMEALGLVGEAIGVIRVAGVLLLFVCIMSM